MWEWFFSNELWVIIVSIAILFFLFFSIRTQFRQSAANGKIAKLGPTKARVIGLGLWAAGTVGLIGVSIALIAGLLRQRGTTLAQVSDQIQAWFIDHGLPILVVVIVSLITYQIIKGVIPGIIERSVKVRDYGDEEERSRRSQTITRIVVSTLGITITVTAILMILAEIAPNITPLLAGAGVAGIAIGFGAQSMVKDVLNGLFIILEDQYRKGDVVNIAGLSGVVEDVSLRRTVLRDIDGTVHAIPNGQVVTASNLTKDWSRVNLDIPLAYYEDVDRAMAIINKVGTELNEDPSYKSMIISPPKALRVDDLGDKGVIIKILGETKPLKQWDVAGEFRRRLKIAFDKEGIAIPWAYGGVFSTRETEASAQQCPACSTPNSSNAKFCANCGASLKQAR